MYRTGFAVRRLIATLILWTLLTAPGCRLFQHSTTWESPEAAYSLVLQNPCAAAPSDPACVQGSARIAEVCRHAAFAAELDAQQSPDCVDAYFDASTAAYAWMVEQGLNHDVAAEPTPAHRAYHAAVAKLISTSQRYQRFDPQRGVKLLRSGTEVWLPITYTGFAWSADDFNRLELVGGYTSTHVRQAFRSRGLGVYLVGIRRRSERERFFRAMQSFPVSAVLLPDQATASLSNSAAVPAPGFRLALYNPLECPHVDVGGLQVPLAGDLTAPLVWQSIGSERMALLGFLHPDEEGVEAQLVMLEPYQPDKIPVVFVHGLLSAPLTWLSVVNDLHASPWFRQHYQVWVYRYPTGKPIMGAAAHLRQELQVANGLDSRSLQGCAPADVVMVGHSMGGLVSKMQITSSGNWLWEAVARRPLETLNASDAVKAQLAQVFYFEPNPVVKRVVFIGTPHHGSAFANRLIGRIVSHLVRFGKSQDEAYRQLLNQNPGAFVGWVGHRFPTSIDLLNPKHPLLNAISSLPISRQVHMHSIIGTGRTMLFEGWADGVVPVSSAHIDGVDSEVLVNATHTKLHHDPATIAEVLRILEVHAAQDSRISRNRLNLTQGSPQIDSPPYATSGLIVQPVGVP